MDYKRIYREFIADRRKKQKALKASGGYYETHHIKPRSLGGSDHARNLIALTHGDHYFAHCCLAKIYGGGMWQALNAMVCGSPTHSRDPSIFLKRRMVAIARERWAEEWRIWDLEACKSDAARFDTRTAWSQGNGAAYRAARLNGWLEECCSDMELKRVPLTKSVVLERARNYQRPSEWIGGCPSSYAAACKNGWLEEAQRHMTRSRRTDGYWTLELCQAEAAKFETRKEWKFGHGASYTAARVNGWLDQCCGHMREVVKPSNYWTIDRCQAEALKYPTRKEFELGCTMGYHTAHRNGWLDEICGHMRSGLHRKLVVCLSDGRVFDSVTEAGKAVGCNPSHISAVCLGKRRSIGGHRWAYADECETTAREG